MKTLEKLTAEQTYMVTDNEANRFNFFGLIEVTAELVQEAENAVEWNLAGPLPEDVKKAANVMAENSVVMDDYTGIVTFDTDEETLYLLTW